MACRSCENTQTTKVYDGTVKSSTNYKTAVNNYNEVNMTGMVGGGNCGCGGNQSGMTSVTNRAISNIPNQIFVSKEEDYMFFDSVIIKKCVHYRWVRVVKGKPVIVYTDTNEVEKGMWTYKLTENGTFEKYRQIIDCTVFTSAISSKDIEKAKEETISAVNNVDKNVTDSKNEIISNVKSITKEITDAKSEIIEKTNVVNDNVRIVSEQVSGTAQQGYDEDENLSRIGDVVDRIYESIASEAIVDVLVDGESVVDENRIANIVLPEQEDYVVVIDCYKVLHDGIDTDLSILNKIFDAYFDGKLVIASDMGSNNYLVVNFFGHDADADGRAAQIVSTGRFDKETHEWIQEFRYGTIYHSKLSGENVIRCKWDTPKIDFEGEPGQLLGFGEDGKVISVNPSEFLWGEDVIL